MTARLLAGRGDELPVSALPADGTYPSGTAAFEKRNVSDTVAAWDPDFCVQCGECSFACPHGVIRAKYFHESVIAGAPAGFHSAPVNVRGFPQVRFTLQLYPEDCTGCGICVEVCPAVSGTDAAVKAIGLVEKAPILAAERANIGFFETLPFDDRARIDFEIGRAHV